MSSRSPFTPCLVTAVTLALASDAHAFEIGHRLLSFVDLARDREIPTDVYYPAVVGGESVPVAPGGPFPAVSVGHGYLIPAGDYGWVRSALVSEGYVVLTPRTAGGAFPDHGEFGLDLAHVLAAVRELAEDPADLLFGAIATGSAVIGHSMGGGAAMLAAAGDPGIDVAVGLAPAETDPSAIAACASIDRPTLILAGSRDCVTPPEDHAIPMYDALGSECRGYVEIQGGSHCQFADPNGLCELGELFCAPPAISRSEQQATVVAYLVPWLDWQLGGDGDAEATFRSLVDADPRVDAQLDCSILSADPAPGPRIIARLHTPEPHPMTATSRFRFDLARAAHARLEVFTVDGRRVRTLVSGVLPAGEHAVVWDGRDTDRRSVTGGIYLVRLQVGAQVQGARVVVLR